MNEEEKKHRLLQLNLKFGNDVTHLANVYEVENEIIARREQLRRCLEHANNEIPRKLAAVIKKGESNADKIDDLKDRNEAVKEKIELFLEKTEPLSIELRKRFDSINKLKQVREYVKSYEVIQDLCNQLKQCNDDEQAVLLYGELKDLCSQYNKGHRAAYTKENTHYWHNVLKDKLTKQYEDVLKLLKWPMTTAQENNPPPKDGLTKFTNITRYLLLIEEPRDATLTVHVTGDFSQDQDPCLPVRILLRPLKKRFAFHFSGPRQTARIDRPEWFLTQTLTWIKDHQGFIRKHVQPVADKLHLRSVKAEDEFNAGLIALAAERLHTVLGLYYTQGLKGEMLDVDAAFAHAVDEALGFHKELVTLTGKETNSVLSVLTRAETFVKWLAVEKKFALAKIDETLSNSAWMESDCVTKGIRGADWLIALLAAIEQRYSALPRPGHRLQFLELQLELIEEWRVRLAQLLSAAIDSLDKDSFMTAGDKPHQLTAVINAAHHTRSVLLQWAHSLHYLQLHYYRRQFQHFTQSQHQDDTATTSDNDPTTTTTESPEIDETLSLKDVEVQAKKLALNEVSKKDSLIVEETIMQGLNPPMLEGLSLDSSEVVMDDSGVFAEAPALLAHLRDEGLAALVDHILQEFKAGLRDYRKQKWHAMPLIEERCVSVSPSLCGVLGALYTRVAAAGSTITSPLADRMRAALAHRVDVYVFEEVVLENWWNKGGVTQFAHDVQRNLVPAFAPPNKVAATINPLPKLNEACKLLALDYDTASRLRSHLMRDDPHSALESLDSLNIRHIKTMEAVTLLGQRCDLNSRGPVMDLF